MFSGGKLKPRIKPKLGCRVPEKRTVESSLASQPAVAETDSPIVSDGDSNPDERALSSDVSPKTEPRISPILPIYTPELEEVSSARGSSKIPAFSLEQSSGVVDVVPLEIENQSSDAVSDSTCEPTDSSSAENTQPDDETLVINNTNSVAINIESCSNISDKLAYKNVAVSKLKSIHRRILLKKIPPKIQRTTSGKTNESTTEDSLNDDVRQPSEGHISLCREENNLQVLPAADASENTEEGASLLAPILLDSSNKSPSPPNVCELLNPLTDDSYSETALQPESMILEEIKTEETEVDTNENYDYSNNNELDPNAPIIDLCGDGDVKIDSNVTVPIPIHDKKKAPKTRPLTSLKTNEKPNVEKKKSLTVPTSRNSNKGKVDPKDGRIGHALNALDYLRRHDHALGGNSILRMRIIGPRSQLSVSSKPTMCATCNPRLLQKCLHTLASFKVEDLETIFTRAEERRKTPMAFLSLSGKPTFKPSLGRQRAPTLSASTYGKMSFEVKENLAKKYGPNAPEMSKLRMIDLIFYNPPENSIDESKGKNQMTDNENTPPEPQGTKPDKLEHAQQASDDEECLDEPCEDEAETASSGSAVPVPQVKIGDEGQIVLAPESLVVKKPETDLSNSPIVLESDLPGQSMKRHAANRLTWDFEDTLKFYKALHCIGTDFSCMMQMFPGRSRKNLKAKFKREEKRNLALVDKVLGAQGSELNMDDVEKDLATDKALKKICREVKYTVSNTNMRTNSTEPCLGSLTKKRTKKSILLAERMEWERSSNKEDAGRVTEDELLSQIVETAPSSQTDSATELIDSAVPLRKPTNLDEPLEEEASLASDNEDEYDRCVVVETDRPDKEKTSQKKSVKRKTVSKKRPIKKRKIVKRKKNTSTKQRIIHTVDLTDSDNSVESNVIDVGVSPAIDPASKSSGECFTIQANFENDDYHCSRSIKFHASDPFNPVDVNETIEHKISKQDEDDTVVIESETVSEVLDIVTLESADQVKSFLESTGGVIIGSHVEVPSLKHEE